MSPQKFFVFLLVFGWTMTKYEQKCIFSNLACPKHPEINTLQEKKRLRHVPQTENNFYIYPDSISIWKTRILHEIDPKSITLIQKNQTFCSCLGAGGVYLSLHLSNRTASGSVFQIGRHQISHGIKSARDKLEVILGGEHVFPSVIAFLVVWQCQGHWFRG